MRKLLNKKIVKRIIAIIILLFILIYIVPFPIDKQVTALEIKIDDPSYLETRIINIKGYYRFNLLQSNTFNGQIYLPDYEMTSREMEKLVFMSNSGTKGAKNYHPLLYSYSGAVGEDGRPETEYYYMGGIYTDPFFCRFVICISEQSEDGNGGGFSTASGRCIVAGAKDREDAMNVLNQYHIIPKK